MDRLYNCRDNLEYSIQNASLTGENELEKKAQEAEAHFRTAMDDDLNTADALSALFDLVREVYALGPESSKGALEAALGTLDRLAGVLGILYSRKKKPVPKEILATVEEREEARKEKNWILADMLRNKLEAEGYLVEDTSTGPKVTKKL